MANSNFTALPVFTAKTSDCGRDVAGVLNIPISLPLLEIQTKIVNHISQLRAQAKALESEAKTILAQAKAEVERMILG